MSLKKDIESKLNAPVRLKAGAPGSLDVFLNGEKIFSKRQAGRSPGADELVNLIRGRVPAG